MKNTFQKNIPCVFHWQISNKAKNFQPLEKQILQFVFRVHHPAFWGYTNQNKSILVNCYRIATDVVIYRMTHMDNLISKPML